MEKEDTVGTNRENNRENNQENNKESKQERKGEKRKLLGGEVSMRTTLLAVVVVALVCLAFVPLLLGDGVLGLERLGVFGPKLPASGEVSDDEQKALKEDIAKVFSIDVDEESTATVFDEEGAEQMKSVGFFKDIAEGDVVLIMYDTGRIIIYRPGERRVINAGPVIDDSAAQEAQTGTAAPAADLPADTGVGGIDGGAAAGE
jgi:hypothetical protein